MSVEVAVAVVGKGWCRLHGVLVPRGNRLRCWFEGNFVSVKVAVDVVGVFRRCGLLRWLVEGDFDALEARVVCCWDRCAVD